MRRIIVLIVLIAFGFGCKSGNNNRSENKNESGEIAVNYKVIKPKDREWASPANGEIVKFNPVSLLWPISRGAEYSIRLSQNSDFSGEVIFAKELKYAMYNPHQQLTPGKWYWQYKSAHKAWSTVQVFIIDKSAPSFVTPEANRFLSMIPVERPRVYAWKSELSELQERAKEYEESKEIIAQANEFLRFEIPNEEDAEPKFEGRNAHESRRIAIDAGKRICDRVQTVVSVLAKAYILTGEEKYARAGVKWIISAAEWDTEGITKVSNFGDSGLMYAMAVGYDTFHDFLTHTEKEKLLEAIAARGAHFYNDWINFLEGRLLSNHVWQHILERLFQTALAVKGDLPVADNWLEYVYELWIARSPVLGYKDGAWSNGISYFRMNTLTMLNINTSLKVITGVDFMKDEWYYNNTEWMIYAWPPNAASDGFGNGAYKLGKSNSSNDPIYISYPDLNSRITGNPYGAWYADRRLEGTGLKLSSDHSLKWFYIQRGLDMQRPEPLKKFELPQARLFREVGIAYMNTDIEHAENNLMLAMKSSPFGSYSHAHAEHNCFNLFYGGEPLFSNTGYRPAMGDPHYLADFKNTRGHNGILIDDMGQPFGSEAYGWMPRFLHGKEISYAVGDATNAYSASDANELETEGNPAKNHSDAGLKRFRRHIVMLRPSMVIVYDELETEIPSDFTFMLHNRENLVYDDNTNSLIAVNEHAKAKSTLYASAPVSQIVSDEFAVTPENWRRNKNSDGSLFKFKNNFHYHATTNEKTNKVRFLAIIQVQSMDGKLMFNEIESEVDGAFKVGDWLIKAELNIDQPAHLEIYKEDGTSALCSSGTLNFDGKKYKGKVYGSSKLIETIDGRVIFQEEIDVLPEIMSNVPHID